MATRLNTQSPNPGVQRGFFGRVINAIREAVVGPTLSVQNTQAGLNKYMKGNPLRIASQRDLTKVTSGRNNLQNRTNVTDAQILNFIDTTLRTLR